MRRALLRLAGLRADDSRGGCGESASEYVDVAGAAELAPGTVRALEVAGHDIVLCRAGDEFAPVGTPAGRVPRGAQVEHEVFDYREKRLGYGMDQDMSITSGQQLGFRSRGFTGVYLSGQEARIRRYHEVIDEYLAGERPARR